ncbi:hypothetical protein [Algoriphagus boritolerans]|uniref:hypothetical protein n=1 Tax=Algoriphagus boritolerans TaxID=308111 RepID=UPI000AED69B5
MIRKSLAFPGELPVGLLRKIKTLRDFDDYFTGPLHGFSDAAEYYRVNSSLQFLEHIEVPTLILNAQNDPFLSESCFPVKLARSLRNIHFEFPKHGGHVASPVHPTKKSFYSELRAVEFITRDL